MKKDVVFDIILILLLSIILICVFASAYVAKTNEKYSKKINRVMSFIALFLVSITSIILIICVCIPSIDLSVLERTSMLFAALVVGITGAMCLLLVKNFKIEILEDGILYHNIFNKTKKIDYEDIELKFKNNVVNIVWISVKNNKTKRQIIRSICNTEPDYELLLKHYNEDKSSNN